MELLGGFVGSGCGSLSVRLVLRSISICAYECRTQLRERVGRNDGESQGETYEYQ